MIWTCHFPQQPLRTPTVCSTKISTSKISSCSYNRTCPMAYSILYGNDLHNYGTSPLVYGYLYIYISTISMAISYSYVSHIPTMISHYHPYKTISNHIKLPEGIHLFLLFVGPDQLRSRATSTRPSSRRAGGLSCWPIFELYAFMEHSRRIYCNRVFHHAYLFISIDIYLNRIFHHKPSSYRIYPMYGNPLLKMDENWGERSSEFSMAI